jgi:flagellar biosynthetic protein FliO
MMMQVGGTTVDPSVGVTGGLRAIASVLLVLALVAGLAWLLRRGSLRLPGGSRRQAITIESATPLGERRTLVIVAVEGRRLLLGLTPAQVSLVTELGPPRPEFAQTLAGQLPGQDGGS